MVLAFAIGSVRVAIVHWSGAPLEPMKQAEKAVTRAVNPPEPTKVPVKPKSFVFTDNGKTGATNGSDTPATETGGMSHEFYNR